MTLQSELAPEILPVLLSNLTTTYPYHDVHFMEAGEPPHDPIATHPAFGNSFDWHSSAHSHWTALHLIGHYRPRTDTPKLLAALEEAVNANLSAAHIEAECAYLGGHPSYERPYGWAWAMALAVHAPTVRPLAEILAAFAEKWLNLLTIPIRHGVHSNTAFALGLMHDAARSLGFDALTRSIEERSRVWFQADRDWPVRFERSGSDFLSPALTEADLMRRVMPPDEFAQWFHAFVPDLSPHSPLLAAVPVPDVTDGQIVHLHGLNLSRAGALARIASTLGEHTLLKHARELFAASSARAVSGHYTETHWLPTFAWDAARSIDMVS